MSTATSGPTPELDARYSTPEADGAMHISTGDDGFRHPDQADPDAGVADLALVFAIRPARAYPFRKGQTLSQARYRFTG